MRMKVPLLVIIVAVCCSCAKVASPEQPVSMLRCPCESVGFSRTTFHFMQLSEHYRDCRQDTCGFYLQCLFASKQNLEIYGGYFPYLEDREPHLDTSDVTGASKLYLLSLAVGPGSKMEEVRRRHLLQRYPTLRQEPCFQRDWKHLPWLGMLEGLPKLNVDQDSARKMVDSLRSQVRLCCQFDPRPEGP